MRALPLLPQPKTDTASIQGESMTPELKTKWVEALRSGRYAQTDGELRRQPFGGRFEYCCLGVLCDVAGKDPMGQNWTGFIGIETAVELGLPPISKEEANCFADGANGIDMTRNMSFQAQAAARNDAGWNFQQIADWIEEQPL